MQKITELEHEVLQSLEHAGQGRQRSIEILHLLWSRRRFMFQTALASLVLSVVLALVWPPTYESTATLMPSENSGSALAGMLNSRMGALGDIAVASSAAAGLGLQTPSAKFIAMLQSRTVADRLIDRFDLMKVYGAKLRLNARQVLEKRTTITEDRRTGIITLTARDRDKYRAAKLANAYVEELVRLNTEMNSSAAHRERVFLEARVNEVKDQMDQVARQLAAYSSKNTVVGLDDQGRAMLDAAAKLQGELIAASAELAGLEQIYTPDNVRVREAKANVAELRRQLLDIRGKDGSSWNAANDQSVFPPIRSLPGLGLGYAELYRQDKILQTVFEILTQQLELSKIEEVKELPTIRVLDAPEVPELRTSPRRRLMVMVITMIGLILAILWVLGEAKWTALADNDPYKLLANQIAVSARNYPHRISFRTHSPHENGAARQHQERE